LATTRVGIIGTGGIAEFQGFAYAKVNNAKIEAVCDIDAGLAEKRAKQWGCTKVYTDYHQMLKDPAIDAVEILLPHQLHKQVVIDAAEAGKHISVMKPMALNAADSKEMIAAARKASVILNVSECYLFYEPISQAIQVIKSGELGAPMMIRMERLPFYDGEIKSSGYPDTWRSDKKKSGGMVFDDISHYDPVARFLLQADIEYVSALLDKPAAAYEIPSLAIWKHKGAAKYGDLAYSWVVRSKMPTDYYGLHESVEVICERGILWIPNISGKLINEAPLVVLKEGNTTGYLNIKADYGDSFRGEVQHFIDSIQNGTVPIFNGEQGLQQVLFCAAIQKSGEESRVVHLTEVDT
jgi:predicted dehydrogenase